MNIGFDFRRGVAQLPDAIEHFAARVNVLWNKEHDPVSGGHRHITAQSITISGNLKIDGDIITTTPPAPATEVPNFTIKSSDPWLKLQDTDSFATNQAWEMKVSGGALTISTLTDDGSPGVTAVHVARTGITPTAMSVACALNVSAPVLAVSDGSAVGLRIRGRPTDNIGGVFYYSNDGGTLYHQMHTYPTYTLWYQNGVERMRMQGLPTPFTMSAPIQLQYTGSPGAGHWYDTSIGTQRWFVGIETNSDTQWRIYYVGAGNVATWNAATSVLFTAWPIHVIAGANADALLIRGRAGDDYGQIRWVNNANNTNFYWISANQPNYLTFAAASGYNMIMSNNNFYPSHHLVGQLGIAPSNMFLVVHAQTHNCTYGGGFTFENRTEAGMYWNPAAGPEIKHASQVLTIWNGRIYTNNYFDVPGTGGFIFANNADIGLRYDGFVRIHNGGWCIACASGQTHLGGPLYFPGTLYATSTVSLYIGGAYYYAWTTGGEIPIVNATATTGLHNGGPNNRWYQYWSWHPLNTASDLRVKNVLGEERLGLDFINRLEPVEYKWKEHPSGKTQHGLVAQQVKRVLEDLQVEFAGLTEPVSDEDHYGLAYTELIGPMIRAIQELAAKVNCYAKVDLERQ